MPKQLNIKLGFEADTKQAQQQIAQLQKSLDGLLNSSIKQGSLTGFNSDIAKAQQSILQLKTALNNSLNADTGRLDLSKFNGQLNSSGLTLSSLSKDMSALGTDGQKAFLNLANSIVTAQKPMVESNKLLDGMWTALKNTARWQMSSSILHGLVGALEGAYGYAQDLNKSLTDIAIVTGRSTDQMAAFAEQANKSAQALSVSTTAYTDAALIYYQQGLDDEAVKARTDITMQMSNVTGESAEHVSSYMTAIWNNFAEGSENLEHYADVITALGAATASSSEEIANGMQQFAAVADTVGLSYEYAATALATVVAQTRQSESTVGNSFRTIFSRLQGLKLGETLEDGTDLNKYSKALATVGVNIKDQNGELKDMDTILDEIGAKWQTLAKDQQIALAQTVGGVRQYTNLVALFDNWDTFQENLNVANTSEGTLQQQADIYAQSWEAAEKRVKAAWQAIYQDLIDDKFFITILNAIEKILQGVDGFIDSIGGLKGVLSGLGVIVTSVFEKQMVAGIQKAQEQLKYLTLPQWAFGKQTSIAESESRAMATWLDQEKDRFLPTEDEDDSAEAVAVDAMRTKLDLTIELKKVNDQLTDSQKQFANELLNTVSKYQDLRVEAAKARQEALDNSGAVKKSLFDKIKDAENSNGITSMEASAARMGLNSAAARREELLTEDGYNKVYNGLTKQGATYGASAADIRKYLDSLVALQEAEDKLEKTTEAGGEQINRFKERIAKLTKENGGALASTEELIGALKKHSEAISEQINELEKKGSLSDDEKKELESLRQEYQETTRDIENLTNAKGKVFSGDTAKGINSAFNGISKLTMGINTLKSAWDTIKNPDASGWQKFSSLMMALSMGFPMIASGITSLGATFAHLGLSIDGVTAETMTFSAALSSTPLGWCILVLGGLAAAWYLLDKAIETPAERLQKTKEKFEEANKVLSDATEIVNQTSEAYENLSNTLDNFTEKENSIDKLTKGTAEWKEAIIESNKELLNALDTAELLNKAQLSRDSNGMIHVDNSEELKELGSNNKISALLYEGISKVYQKQINKELAIASMSDRFFQEGDTLITWDDLSIDENGLYEGIKPQDSFDNTTLADGTVISDIETLTGYAQAILDANVEDISLTKDSANKLASMYPETLGFLSQISDRQDLLDGISKVVDAIETTDYESDTYKSNTIQDILLAGGVEIPELPESEKTEFFSKLYDKLYDNYIPKLDDIDFKNEDTKLAAYQAYADLHPNISLMGKELVDTSGSYDKNITDEIPEEAIKLAYATEQMKKVLLDNIDNIIIDINDETKKIKENTAKRLQEQGLTKNLNEGNEFLENKTAVQLEFIINHSGDYNSLEELEAALDKLEEEEHNIQINISANNLNNFKGKDEELMAEVTAFGKFIHDNIDDYPELSKHLGECQEAAEGTAWALIRVDDAMQDVSKSSEEWKAAFKSKDIYERKQAFEEMRKAYANLLNVDISEISENFVKDEENLNRFITILNGTENEAVRAYDELQRLNFIETGMEINPDIDWSGLYAELQTAMDEANVIMGQDFVVGGDVRYEGVEAQLNEMVAMAGNNKALAEQLLHDAGWTGELTNEPTESVEETQLQDYKVEMKDVPWSGSTPNFTSGLAGMSLTAGPEITGSIPMPVLTPNEPQTIKTTKKTQVQSYHLKPGTTAQYTGGGAGNIKNLPTRRLGGGGSGKRGSCFIAGTQISLSNSYKNIEDIKPGDIVLSYNEKKKKNVFNKVLQTMIHFVHEKIYSLFIKDEKIKATGNHKFLVIHNNNQKWTEVSDIQIGDLVLFSDGTWHEISDINYEVKHETVYNFEVSDTHNYYVGKNQVLAHNKGGGGGKNSAPKKQKREKPVQEKDRYHDLKEKIKDLTTETSRLEKISSRVWGKEKLKYMDQEIKKQEKQIDLTKEYIKEAKNYLAEDKKRLDEIKMGAEYVKDDNTGEWLLTNYEEVLQNIVDAQNKAVDAFNDAKGRYENGEISEDELKAQEEAFNLDKEKFEERKKILKQYEDTYNTVQEQMEKLIDDQWKLYDLKLEKVKVEVELELKVSDQSKKILEWSFKYLGNDLDAVSDKVANLSSQMNYLAQDLATAQKGISGIFANHGINFNWNENTPVDQIVKDLKSQIGGSVYSALTESEVDALMEYMNKLMEVHDAAAEKMKEVMETFSDAVEKANEKLERQLNRFDGLKSTLTTYQDIVNLTGKNILKITSKNLEDLNKAMIQNDQNKLTSARAIYETNKGMYEAARTELNEALASGDAQLVEQLEEQLNSLEDTMNDALENYRDALKETLEDVQQAWEDALDAMEEAYEEAFGNLGSNWYQEQFDRQKELNELYLPDYKKYHELNKSITELQKNLANTNNQIVKGKAKELLEDINDKMKSGAQVSEYEAGIIERRVALLKAEDELLAARNAKSTVRMTRDNEGGFSYTYTADEDQINNAQQGYSDAYYELRDYQVTGANDLQSQWLQIQGEFAQRVREIEEQYKDNETARTEALKQLQAEYQTYVNYFSDQMGVVYKWESTLRDNDLKDLQRVTGLKLDEWDTYITSWNDTLLNTVIPGYDTYDQLLNTWDKAMNTAITSVNKAHDNYRKNVEVTMDKAGMSVNGFKEQFEKDMANVQLDSDQTTSNIRTLTETTMTNFGKALAKVSGFTQDYLANFYKIREDNEDTIISIQGIITALSGLNTSMDTANEKARTLKTDTVTTISSALTEMANAFDSVAESARGAGTEIDNTRAKEEAYGNEMVKVTYEGKTSVMQRKYVPSGWTILGPAFDTGGYTGDWHSSKGKLAVLHEKELVLNKEDTKNMLDAVNVIRSMQTPINGLARNMFNYNSLSNVGSADTLEQQVHIDASFPNVSDHNEIELALDNLINSASQYINRK